MQRLQCEMREGGLRRGSGVGKLVNNLKWRIKWRNKRRRVKDNVAGWRWKVCYDFCTVDLYANKSNFTERQMKAAANNKSNTKLKWRGPWHKLRRTGTPTPTTTRTRTRTQTQTRMRTRTRTRTWMWMWMWMGEWGEVAWLAVAACDIADKPVECCVPLVICAVSWAQAELLFTQRNLIIYSRLHLFPA